jgi:hypothetical protein
VLVSEKFVGFNFVFFFGDFFFKAKSIELSLEARDLVGGNVELLSDLDRLSDGLLVKLTSESLNFFVLLLDLGFGLLLLLGDLIRRFLKLCELLLDILLLILDLLLNGIFLLIEGILGLFLELLLELGSEFGILLVNLSLLLGLSISLLNDLLLGILLSFECTLKLLDEILGLDSILINLNSGGGVEDTRVTEALLLVLSLPIFLSKSSSVTFNLSTISIILDDVFLVNEACKCLLSSLDIISRSTKEHSTLTEDS